MYGRDFKGNISFTPSPLIVIRRAAKDSERVSLIAISTVLEGDMWKVLVSVTFGEFYDQGKKQIAAYRVHEGEKARIKELAQYGLKPFDVSIVRVKRVRAIQPEIVNQTNSIAVLSVKATVLPLPYRIIIKNTSVKAVQALEITAYKERKMLFLTWSSGTWNHPLIGAGREHNLEMPSDGWPEGFSPSEYLPDQSQIIEISTVVFADGTYEGKPFLAGVQRAGMLGNRLQLDRVLPLIQNALDATDFNSALSRFKEAVSALDEIVEHASSEELTSQFPTLSEGEKDNLLIFAKAGLRQVKSDVASAIAEFERSLGQAANSEFKAWLDKEKEKYEKWRSKLS